MLVRMMDDTSQIPMTTVATSNPWLNIPLDDYEGHMSLPTVGQAQMIADQLDRAVARWVPKSVAVIGCAGGNGLERIAAGTVEHVVAVDVNPDYIERTRIRHAQRLGNLELVCADIQSESITYSPVDLTYAALLFEYVDIHSTLKTLKRNCRPSAFLTTVLQLPHSSIHAVSPSPYKSLGRLASAITLVAPEALGHAAADVGFTSADAMTIELTSGKMFCVQNFRA
jgi:2-polyprenyl-3-methyl-5-hydroxy-6-metoxy-1,4-benzoquinol methylase